MLLSLYKKRRSSFNDWFNYWYNVWFNYWFSHWYNRRYTSGLFYYCQSDGALKSNKSFIVGTIGSVDDLIEKNEEIIKRIIAFSKMIFDSIYESSKTERLGKSIKFVKGKQPSISERKVSKRYLTIETLTSGDSDVISSEGVLCKESDVLMVMDGASSGRCFIGNDGYVGSTLTKIDTNGINQAILFFALNRHEKEIEEHTTGSAIPHADKSFVSELFYPIVDTETASSFERLISIVVSKRKENLKLKALKTVLLAKYF